MARLHTITYRLIGVLPGEAERRNGEADWWILATATSRLGGRPQGTRSALHVSASSPGGRSCGRAWPYPPCCPFPPWLRRAAVARVPRRATAITPTRAATATTPTTQTPLTTTRRTPTWPT